MKAIAMAAVLIFAAGDEIPTGKFAGKFLLVFEYNPKERALQIVTGEGLSDLQVLEIRAKTKEGLRYRGRMGPDGRLQGEKVNKPFAWEMTLILYCPIEEIINSKKELEGVMLLSPDKCQSIVSEKLK